MTHGLTESVWSAADLTHACRLSSEVEAKQSLSCVTEEQAVPAEK